MVSRATGTALRTGLPVEGTLRALPPVETDSPDRACHETGVILGDALRAACDGGNGVTVFSMDPADGGSLEQPVVQYSRSFPGVAMVRRPHLPVRHPSWPDHLELADPAVAGATKLGQSNPQTQEMTIPQKRTGT